MTVWSRQKILRRASAADIPVIMEIERQPGYDKLVGRFCTEQHLQNLARPGYLYFVHDDAGGRPDAFAAVSGLGSHDGAVMLNRMIVRTPGRGLGSLVLGALMETVFDGAPTNRLLLRVLPDNMRALTLYRRHGFREERILEKAGTRPDGLRVDLLLMSISYDDWAARNGD